MLHTRENSDVFNTLHDILGINLKKVNILYLYLSVICFSGTYIDWLQSIKQFFINVSYHILVASLTLMALFYGLAQLVILPTNFLVGN